jgi:sugar/nucleoside kinase (ribokinase family)
MKYLVIGEPCVDLIHKENGDVIHSYGGVLYSIISLAVLSGINDNVYPLMNLGEDEYDNITNILKEYPKIKLDGVNKVAHPTKKVHLYVSNYRSGKKAKIEHSQADTYTLPFESIDRFLPDADAILINMISGVDISLDTLKKIRTGFKGFIHIDIHNLVMKTNNEGFREHTNLEHWREWCTNTDTIQMNEYEIGVLSKEKRNDYEIAEEILINLNNSMTGVIVTKGKLGVSGFTRKEKTFGSVKFFDLDRYDVQAIENPRFVDTTGCGDVFGASFTVDFSKTKDLKKGLHYATRIASFKTSVSGIYELKKLK